MGSVWELDFYSRPVLDDNQKKLWEVLICEGIVDTQANPDKLFRYSKFLPNTEVNSINLREAIQEAMEQAGTPQPHSLFSLPDAEYDSAGLR
jgi:hypothetical protein